MAGLGGLLLLAVASLASAAKLTVSIAPSQLLENPNELPASSHAVLLGPPGIRYDAPLRRDNTFMFPDLEAASYLLTLHSRDYFFPPLRVDVTANPGESSGHNISAWQTFRGNEWSNKGPHFGTAQDELKINLVPAGRKDFYQQRGGFNVLSFLKSPMILMGLVSVVMIFGLPYLMENSELPLQSACLCTIIKADMFQWTPKQRQNSKRCRKSLLLQDREVRQARCRISILRVSLQGNRVRLRNSHLPPQAEGRRDSAHVLSTAIDLTIHPGLRAKNKVLLTLPVCSASTSCHVREAAISRLRSSGISLEQCGGKAGQAGSHLRRGVM